MQILGYVLVVLGIFFIFVGLLGIYKFDNVYERVLAASDIDTMGLITILIGMTILGGATFYTLKVILTLVTLVIINPIVTSSIVSSAYHSGQKLTKKVKK